MSGVGQTEKVNASADVKADNLCIDGKGRVIHHYTVGRIVIAQIIPTGVKRSDYWPPLYIGNLSDEMQNSFIDFYRRITIICSFFGLNFSTNPL